MRRKVTPVVSMRIPKELLAEIDQECGDEHEKRGRYYRKETRTGWILEAIRLRLKNDRAKRAK